MPSFDNYEFRYNKPDGGPKEANDITIVFDAQVGIVGVDGVAPDDPKAEYAVDGDGSATIKIRKITKGDNDTIKVRAKGSGPVAPRVTTAFWTRDGTRIPKALSQIAAAPIDADLDAAGLANAALAQVMFKVEYLSRRMDSLARPASVLGIPAEC